MDISILNWIMFAVAGVYLLILPGANLIRTLGWQKRYGTVELAVVAFALSIAVMLVVTLALALPFSIGINFYTLVIFETLAIVLTSKEVVSFFGGIVKRKTSS